jgi:hypothetical protein
MSERPAFLAQPLFRGKMCMIRVFSLTCLLVFSVTGHTSTVQFNGAKAYPVGSLPHAVVTVDLNGDGKLDLAVGNQSGLSILIGNGDGSFQTANTFIAGTQINSVAAADLNGDTSPDLIIIAGGISSAQVEVLLNNGDATFGAAQTVVVIPVDTCVAVADVNGDLKPDLAVCDFAAKTIRLFFGNGDGTFQAPMDVPSAVPPLFIQITDFNGDHRQDLAVTNYSGFDVWLGNGDGTFQLPVFFTNRAGISSIPYTLDLNQDGKTDVAEFATDILNHNSQNTFFLIRLGNGDGTFQPPEFIGNASGASWQLADFDGDRVPDAVAVGGGSVFVLLNNGDATFQAPLSTVTVASSAGIAASDLNGDGGTDVIVTNPAKNTVSVLLNAGTQFSLNTLTLTPPSITRGQTATGTLTMNLLNSFVKPISLSCTVAASARSQGALPSCSIVPSPVTPNANGNATAKLTVNTSSSIASIIPGFRHVLLPFAVASLGVFCLTWDSSRRCRLAALTVLAVFGGLAPQVACGGGSSTPPPSSIYTITVTAQAGTVQQTTSTVLTVQSTGR